MKIALAVSFALLGALALNAFGQEQMLVGAVFIFAVVLWSTEALPLGVTALVSTAFLVLLGVTDANTAFAAYGDPVILLFVGSFILAKSMECSGLDKRMALWVLRSNFSTKTPSRLLLTFGVIACVISLFVSNTAVTAMLLPVGLHTLSHIGVLSKDSKFTTSLLLMLTYGSSVAVGVIVGTPPNLIVVSELKQAVGLEIGFTQWMIFAMPITILMLAASWVLLRLFARKELPDTSGVAESARAGFVALGKMRPSEKFTLLCFSLALIMWVLPDASAMILGGDHAFAVWLKAHLSPTVAALIAATLLFALPGDEPRVPAMTWKKAITIDWGTILLFGGGIALGSAMFSSGLAESLGQLLTSAMGVKSVFALTLLCTFLGTLMSEAASNTAAATTMVPLAIGLSLGADISPIGPALGAALGASLGFMLPISTPPNAIIYGSGLVPVHRMVRIGLLLDLVGVFTVALSLHWLIGLANLR